VANRNPFGRRKYSKTRLIKAFFSLLSFIIIFTSNLCYGQTGSIYITSNPPGAEISLDNNPIGVRTDKIISDVITGPHRISVELPGYGKSEKTVEVKDGLTADAHFNLQPAGVAKPSKDAKQTKGAKETRETKEAREAKDAGGIREAREAKEVKDAKEMKDANDATTYHTLGFSYFDKGEYDMAIADFSKAINLDPEFLLAYYNRGVAYFDKGDFDQAINDFSRAMELGLKGKGSYHIRGVAYGKKGQYDMAVADFTKALELDPKDATVYNNRGIMFLLKGQYKQTVADLTKAIELDSKNSAEYYFHLAYVLYRMGESERAQENFSRAKEIDKDIVAKRGEFFQKSTNPKIKRLYAEELISASQFLDVQTHILGKAKDLLGEVAAESLTPLPLSASGKKSFFKRLNPWLVLVVLLVLFAIVVAILAWKFLPGQKRKILR
jgi:Tfp pilus assembly protein PilF